MNANAILAAIVLIVLILQNATQILAALAELLRACLPVVHAARALIAAITHPSQLPADTDQEDADRS
ncbi:hypothetical protein [Nocardia farcinica]|uniref:hypothetical protein n=1 Tax=Nocardia farcinica TaxID=37329 RepID=UPI002456C90E|nr:hypothetical protein [Nocardia farcinica]